MKKFLTLVLISAICFASSGFPFGLRGQGVHSLLGTALAAEWYEDEFLGSSGSSTGSWSGGDSGSDGENSAIVYNGKVAMEGELLNHDIAKVAIVISGMQTPVLGIAFHLKYDATMLSFLRYDPGSFLENGGDPFYLVSGAGAATGEGDLGRVIFGETLRRNDSFPIGNGTVATFYFQRLKAGENGADASGESSGASGEKYSFEFEKGVVSTLDTVRQDIDKINFENFVLDENTSGLSATTNSLGSSAFASSGSIGSANAVGSLLTGVSVVDFLIILGFAVVGVLSAVFFLRFTRKKDRI